MTPRLVILAWLLALPCAQAQETVAIGTSDETGFMTLIIEAVATGLNAEDSYEGCITSGGDMTHRVITDQQGRVVFAYDVGFARGSAADIFEIRARPVDADYAEEIRAGTWSLQVGACTGSAVLRGSPTPPRDSPVPTIESVRQFSEVKSGESVTISALNNPATGDMVHDDLMPVDNSNLGFGISRGRTQAGEESER